MAKPNSSCGVEYSRNVIAGMVYMGNLSIRSWASEGFVAMTGDKTRKKHDKAAPNWKPGESGNPAGRPKGSRNKLGEAFIRDLFNHWGENGKKALDDALKASPAQYMRVVASLLPKDITVKMEDPLGHLSDTEIKALLDAARNLGGAVSGVVDEEREGESGSVH